MITPDRDKIAIKKAPKAHWTLKLHLEIESC